MAATKTQQLLQLNPASEIVFVGPFDHVVTSYLELNNPTDDRICFKVKTTAPRRYCVRPNSGIVNPNGKQRIAIMLQPIGEDSQSERSKHKFMVQSTIIKDENTNLDEVWKEAKPESVMDSKLRCVFQASSLNEDTQAQKSTSLPATEKSKTATPIVTQTVKAQAKQSASSSGDIHNKSEFTSNQQPLSSTPTTRANKSWGANELEQNLNRSDLRNKSVASSSHNLTSSFLQPMSDDHKILIVSLIMLIIGVILGKYII